MDKQIKIDYKLFLELIQLIVIEDTDETLYKNVKQQLENKFKKVLNHELYSKYKLAETADEREKARLEYLNSIGIHKDFKW